MKKDNIYWAFSFSDDHAEHPSEILKKMADMVIQKGKIKNTCTECSGTWQQ